MKIRRNQIIFSIGILCLVAIAAAWMMRSESKPLVTISGDHIQVEIADTKAEQVQGLSGRQSLQVGHGMLFVFQPARSDLIFWMNDMYIDLDMVWIADETIVAIDRGVPAPATGEEPATREAPSGQPIEYVLEVASGVARDWNPGDRVTIQY